MPTRFIDAAHKKMISAKLVLEACQRDYPDNIEKVRALFKELSTATDQYVKAVDDYLAKSKSLHSTTPTENSS
jgi:hypothetical protein